MVYTCVLKICAITTAKDFPTPVISGKSTSQEVSNRSNSSGGAGRAIVKAGEVDDRYLIAAGRGDDTVGFPALQPYSRSFVGVLLLELAERRT